jgi:hypothetical protein
MKKHKVQKTAKNLVGSYGTKEAMRIVIEENDMYFRKCQFLNEVFLEIINLGTEETERKKYGTKK